MYRCMAMSVRLLIWWKQECPLISLMSMIGRLSEEQHSTTELTSFVICWRRKRTWINKIVLVGQRYIMLLGITALTSLGYYYNMEQEKMSRIMTFSHQFIGHVNGTTKKQLIYWDNIRWALLTNSLITSSCFTLHSWS